MNRSSKSRWRATVVWCTIKDDLGSIKLSLCDDLIDKVNVGNTLRAEDGYVNWLRGELNVGR